MWVAAGFLVLLVAGIGAGFAWVSSEGDDTISLLRNHLDPASDTVRDMSTSVRGNEVAYLEFLLTGDEALLDESHVQAARAARDLMELERTSGSVPVVQDALPTLKVETKRWLDTVQSPSNGSPADGATSNAERAKARVDASQELLATTQKLSLSLNAERDATWDTAFRDRGNAFLFVEAFSVLLLVLLVGLAWLTSRRVVLPLAELERRMREAAEGQHEGSAKPGRSWLTGLATESERLRMRMREYYGDSLRSREALELEGETSIGMNRILTRTGDPGAGVAAHGVVVPAEGVIAGDFLDIVALPDGTTALVQGDISGHGVQAGLLAAQAKSAVLSVLRQGYGPQSAVRAAWTVLVGDDEERFLTLVIAVVDPVRQAVAWVNAGHVPPFLRRTDRRVDRLEPTGPLVSPLVTDRQAPWGMGGIRFGPGDLLVISTDGLTEARDESGRQLGDERVEEILAAWEGTDPATVVRSLFQSAQEHGAGWQRDDVTILAAALQPRESRED